MEIVKLGASKIMPIIRHNLRCLRPGQTYGNESIDPTLSYKNYDLAHRGNTPEEINNYRKNLEKEIFAYKRKNLIHAVSVVIQLPKDCSPEQEEEFFKACYSFWCDQLPMGERSIFQAQVHKDEIVIDHAGNRISNNHIHLMYVPGVPDAKHEGYAFKLCADQLTKRSILKKLHPALQKYLDDLDIRATVYHKNGRDGQTIKLSISQLKEFTKLTGTSIPRTMTIEDLADFFNHSYESEHNIQELTEEILALKEKLSTVSTALETAEKETQKLQSELSLKEERKRTFVFGSSYADKREERSLTF